MSTSSLSSTPSRLKVSVVSLVYVVVRGVFSMVIVGLSVVAGSRYTLVNYVNYVLNGFNSNNNCFSF